MVGAEGDVPDLSWKKVPRPRHGAIEDRLKTRALLLKLRSVRTLKYASGMTSTRLKDGDALRRRSSALMAGAAKKRRSAAASFRLSWTRASASTGHPSNAPHSADGRSFA